MNSISFREKKAWVTMTVLVMVFVPFYLLMMDAYHRPNPDFGYLGQLALTALSAFIGLEIVLILVARFLSPDDAGIPQDEREQLFAFRAARVSYIALIVLVVAVTFPMIHMEGRNWGWGMAYLGVIILSEILRAIMLIVQYRRGY